MAKNNKADMSCARVKKYTASDVSKAERHNERKNETYENMNVIEERISAPMSKARIRSIPTTSQAICFPMVRTLTPTTCRTV